MSLCLNMSLYKKLRDFVKKSQNVFLLKILRQTRGQPLRELIMQISRFSKSFLLLIVVLVSLSSLFILRRPLLAYKEPWSGAFFGEGSVEQHNSVTSKMPHQWVDGEVIMGKLGNNTAK